MSPAPRRTQKPDDLSPYERLYGKLPELNRADIVLIHHKKDFFRYFLRKVMGSYWDHTALVLYPRKPEHGRNYDVFIEAIKNFVAFGVYFRFQGVNVHRLTKYLDHPEKYDIGVKRVTTISEEEKRRVCYFMLMNVDAPYWRWKRVRIVFAALFKGTRKRILQWQRFSCSGLIQNAFFTAVEWRDKHKVIFRQQSLSPVELQELTSPGDIAESPLSEWIYNRH